MIGRDHRRDQRGPRVAYRASVLTPARAAPGQDALRFLPDALVVVDTEGRIESVRDAAAAPFDGFVHDLSGSLVVPAFVDAHLHFPQTRVIGSASGPLLDWLSSTVFPEEARFMDSAYAAAVAEEFVQRCAAVGTGTIGAFSSSSASATAVLFETLLARGLRGVVGLTLMDERCPDALRVPADRALGEARELCDRFQDADDGRVAFAVTPRFAISCSEALMRGAGELANERGLVVQTHVAENEREGAETLELFPWAKDYLDVYDQLGLLGPRTLLAHAIHLSRAEWDRVAERGAAIVHCPDSNFFLGSGRMRFAEATARGVRVALGSDVAAGRTFDIRRAIGHAYDNALALGAPRTLDELFRAATLGGAEALGWADKTGSIEVGKEADFAVLALPRWMDRTSRKEALRAACFGSEFAPVRRTYVRGRLIYRA
ncbi:MAG: guanine deaminase [Polyangiaceae bacterium]